MLWGHGYDPVSAVRAVERCLALAAGLTCSVRHPVCSPGNPVGCTSRAGAAADLSVRPSSVCSVCLCKGRRGDTSGVPDGKLTGMTRPGGRGGGSCDLVMNIGCGVVS